MKNASVLSSSALPVSSGTSPAQSVDAVTKVPYSNITADQSGDTGCISTLARSVIEGHENDVSQSTVGAQKILKNYLKYFLSISWIDFQKNSGAMAWRLHIACTKPFSFVPCTNGERE